MFNAYHNKCCCLQLQRRTVKTGACRLYNEIFVKVASCWQAVMDTIIFCALSIVTSTLGRKEGEKTEVRDGRAESWTMAEYCIMCVSLSPELTSVHSLTVHCIQAN